MISVILTILCLVLIIMFGTTIVPIIMKLLIVLWSILKFVLKIGIIILFIYFIVVLFRS